MIKVISRILAMLICVAAFSSLGVTAHATTNATHGQHRSTHTDKSQSCASVCLSVPTGKGVRDRVVSDDDDDFGDTEAIHFSVLVRLPSDSIVHTSEAIFASKFHPPPGTPGYIANAVFRI